MLLKSFLYIDNKPDYIINIINNITFIVIKIHYKINTSNNINVIVN